MRNADQIRADAYAAAAVEVARQTLDDYNTRKGMAERPGNWDLVMAARLASDTEALLKVIEKMARP